MTSRRTQWIVTEYTVDGSPMSTRYRYEDQARLAHTACLRNHQDYWLPFAPTLRAPELSEVAR
jgi:hypothetical protein